MGRGESAAQGECPRTGQTNTHTMPLMLELKYEYFISDWPGRIKLAELLLALLCMMCSAPAYEGPQHWFLIVVVLAFLGTIFFSLYYICLAESQQTTSQLVDGGVLVHCCHHLLLLHRLRGDVGSLL